MTVDHDQFYKDPITGAHTNNVEGIYHGIISLNSDGIIDSLLLHHACGIMLRLLCPSVTGASIICWDIYSL
jgi:hypothetical protein